MEGKPQEFRVTKHSTLGIPQERLLDCICGVTIRSSCSEIKCPNCNTILLGSIDKSYGLYEYQKNENYYQDFVEWAYKDAERQREIERKKQLSIN